MIEISAKERKKILKSLRGGTVPNQGILRLAVGRNNELNAILKDCEDISEGLNSFRIFIGDYGTGKTFLLSLAREYAQKKNICTCHADLDPQKRLHSNKGDALSLYRQLISNLSTRLKPNGGALKSVIEKYLKSQRINDLRDKLNELDTSKTEPLTSVAETTLKLRKDKILSKNIREDILKNSPEKNKDFFVVPKVVEKCLK